MIDIFHASQYPCRVIYLSDINLSSHINSQNHPYILDFIHSQLDGHVCRLLYMIEDQNILSIHHFFQFILVNGHVFVFPLYIEGKNKHMTIHQNYLNKLWLKANFNI